MCASVVNIDRPGGFVFSRESKRTEIVSPADIGGEVISTIEGDIAVSRMPVLPTHHNLSFRINILFGLRIF